MNSRPVDGRGDPVSIRDRLGPSSCVESSPLTNVPVETRYPLNLSRSRDPATTIRLSNTLSWFYPPLPSSRTLRWVLYVQVPMLGRMVNMFLCYLLGRGDTVLRLIPCPVGGKLFPSLIVALLHSHPLRERTVRCPAVSQVHTQAHHCLLLG